MASVAPAGANVGKRSREAQPSGEPLGITDIRIAREELVIDLRPLADQAIPKVKATYHLDNTGAEKRLDLVFVNGSRTGAFVIELDGKSVATQSHADAPLPPSWSPPRSTPGLDGGEIPYEVAHASPVGFELVVPPGAHDLVVAFEGYPVIDHAGDPTLRYQYGYVLAPARSWAGFGGLDVTVHVPAGWLAAVAPAMPREGDTFHAVFPTVPADTVGVTLRAPDGAHAIAGIATKILFALVALGGLFGIVAWTRNRERRRHDVLAASKVAAFGRGLVWGAAFLATGMFAVLGPDLTLPSNQVDHYGYGDAFAIVGVVLGAIVVILVGTITSIVAGNRVHAPRPPPT